MIMTGQLKSTRFCLLVLAAALAACSSDDSPASSASTGKRIAVMESARKPAVDPSLSGYSFEIPEPAVINAWPQNGGNTQHSVGNPSLAAVPEVMWTADIGSGSNADYKLLSPPVISETTAFVMDARGRVSAYNLKDGDRLWQIETVPQDRDGDAMGGGVALHSDTLYATTGFGEVLALRSTDGAIKWRKMLGKPLRSAPTVAEGRVFAITIENETYALDANTGNMMWRHSGIAENATLMGASSPAVRGATVVVTYSSGEVFGLRAQNGRIVWGDVLAVPTQIGALPAIADIRGLPVMDLGRVYSISHSGRMAAIDERTGEREWEADLGGVNTPSVAGNAVFMVTLNSELVAVSRSSGRIIWTVDLQRFKDADDRDSKQVSWWGPVMAGGRLWLTNSLGELAAYAPETGAVLYREDLTGSFFLPPVVANNTMYMLSDSGKLFALR